MARELRKTKAIDTRDVIAFPGSSAGEMNRASEDSGGWEAGARPAIRSRHSVAGIVQQAKVYKEKQILTCGVGVCLDRF
jgi:hypothetical protein